MKDYGEGLSKQEGCGIAGIALTHGNAALPLFYALYALQHRGQESAGIAVSSNLDGGIENELPVKKRDITLVKGMGLVYQVFSPQQLELLNGNIGIGHVRYATTGASRIENALPLLVNYRKGKIAIAHNGNLVNAMELRRELEREGRIFHSDTDTEVIAQLLAKELMRHDPIAALKEVMKRVIGSYSLTILLNNTLIAVRDPLGIKPLCIGELREGNGGMHTGYAIASESTAIETLGGDLIRDVKPGEVLVINPFQSMSNVGTECQGAMGMDIESYELYRCINSAHCVFEYIYFARPDSILDGRLVYDVRMKIGERLAEEDDVEADIVSPVPDSGITFAIGYAKRAGIDYMEGLIKNRYVGRTFIMPEQTSRTISVRLKLSVVETNVVGKRIVLVDDSIVRGTTSRIIVDFLKKKGAKEVHLRIGSPPIIAPCYLGIDTPTRKELVAWKRSIDEIGMFLNVDSIRYLSLEGLIDAVGIEEKNLCLGCLTGNYPVEIPGEVCIARQLKLTHF